MWYIRLSAWLMVMGAVMGQEFKVDVTINPDPSLSDPQTGRVQTEPLDDATYQRLFTHMPPLPETGPSGNRLPKPSLKPPQPGDQVVLEMLQSEAPPPELDDRAPFRVLRYAPEGARDQVTQVQVAFSHDVIPITALDDLDAIDVPVTITPEPPGRWRWLDPRTLVFDGERVFPRATRYQVKISGGTVDLNGRALEEPVIFSFSTPAPSVIRSMPQGRGFPLNPIIALEFDQDMDWPSVMRHLQLMDGDNGVALQVLSPEEWPPMLKGWHPTRTLAFKPAKALEKDRSYVVKVSPGLASAEGPLTSEKGHEYSFQTYGPFQILGIRCGWQDRCEPGWPWHVTLSNPVDEETVKAEYVRVTPELPGLTVHTSGTTLSIQGQTKGNAKYNIRLGSEIKDIYGQSLEAKTLQVAVQSSPPQYRTAFDALQVMDPVKDPKLPLASLNIADFNLRLYDVSPSDWGAYIESRQTNGLMAFLAKTKAQNAATFKGNNTVDQWQNKLVPLNTLSRHTIAVLEPRRALAGALPQGSEPSVVWLQATEIAIDAFHDNQELVVWTSSLRDGHPLSGVHVALTTGKGVLATAISDKNGLARMNLPLQSNDAAWLVAELGNDSAFLPENPRWWSRRSNWVKQLQTSRLLWHIFDDRGLYKPGERAEIRGWIRRDDHQGQLVIPSGVVTYQVRDPRGQNLVSGQTDLNASGGFHFALEFPEDMNLGAVSMVLTYQGQTSHHALTVDTFRRPEFEVNLQKLSDTPLFNEEIVLEASAKYYTGEGLASAPVDWTFTLERGHYQPPHWPEYQFGEHTPWWCWYGYSPTLTETSNGVTSGDGSHKVALTMNGSTPVLPISLSAEARVTDVNRQQWSAQQQFLVHPSNRYVGIKLDRSFYQSGQMGAATFIVTDLDGALQSGLPVSVEVVRSQWKYVGREWKQQDESVGSFQFSSTDEPHEMPMAFEQPGSYSFKARVVDDQDRVNESVLSVWVSGGQAPPVQDAQADEIVIMADRDMYEPEDAVSLFMRLPFSSGYGAVMIRGNGEPQEIPFASDSEEATVTFDLGPEVSDISVQVVYAGRAPRGTGEPEPRMATAQTTLAVSRASKRLSVAIHPQNDVIVPGSETEFCVQVTDAQGNPISSADVCLFAVDEAVLGLTGYQLGDPIASFYPNGAPMGRFYLMRQLMLILNPEFAMDAEEPMMESMQMMRAPASAAQSEGFYDSGDSQVFIPATPNTVRKKFDALGFYEPFLVTDGAGRVCVTVTMPDSATRYRVMAVAVKSDHMGHGEANLTARQPLLIRPSLPRFLNYGDQAELPVVIHNGSSKPQRIAIALRSSDAIQLQSKGYQLDLGADAKAEVLFPVRVRSAGTAHFQVVAGAADYSDAVQVQLPVWTPATREGFAVYGSLEAGKPSFHQVSPPKDALEDFGGLDVSLATTQLQTLSDAVIYLWEYPYACTEQLASRILSVTAMGDLLTIFQASGLPDKAIIDSRIRDDVALIEKRQTSDGSFGTWRPDSITSPFMTAHAVYALLLAKQRGVKVSEDVLNKAGIYLQRMATNPTKESITTKAYAVFVRSQLGHDVYGDLQNLKDTPLTKWPADALAFASLAHAADPSFMAELIARVRETAGSAVFTHGVRQEDPVVLASDRRSDALGLWAGIEANQDEALMLKLVRGLMGHRVRGRWSNTQENVFVLLALNAYVARFESQTPDLVAQVWLGEKGYLEEPFTGRNATTAQGHLPMEFVREPMTLAVNARGEGRLFYRLGLNYAPASLKLEPRRQGFTVTRAYESDKGDVVQREDGSWWMRAGSEVLVRVTMVVPESRNHVALVDWLPAGLEPVGMVANGNGMPTRRSMGWWQWYEHHNLRDERVEAFSTRLNGGVYELTYTARATTPGTFQVPPAHAEEMYSPETFGRSESTVVTVSE
ncbi:MAG: hypothetical protein KDC35_14725 [Acidobacteria bacterium]|nr:hypothetical protein [Acidobacteriota bacterium]